METHNSNKFVQPDLVKIYLETENKGTITFQLKRSALLAEMSQNQKKNIQDNYQIPAKCATLEVINVLEKYLGSKNVGVYKDRIHDIDILIGTLRFTDFLGMSLFQENFISQIVSPSINTSNCVPFLEETHKKLKNQENGSQCWYSLLNACITYLAQHLSEVYLKSQQKIKGLHQKILNQILDRAIRNGNNDEQKIFELIMKSRKTDSVHHLCEVLRKAILSKKINPKIHAKLSWKLQDVSSINQKKTKNFKFLDYDWMLEASRNKNNELQVNLTYCGIEGKVEIGAFYLKLIWWSEGNSEQKREQDIRISYLLMNKKYELPVLTISQQKQKQLGKIKIELSIFCCMDQIYTFTLKYIASNHQKLNLEQRQLSAEELEIIARLFKEKREYNASIRYLKYLTTMTNVLPMDLISTYPLSELNAFELDFIQKINSQKGGSHSQISVQSRISSQNSEVQSISSSNSRRLQERPESKGRLRKIFAASPSRSNSGEAIRLQDINRITNLQTYFYDRNHPLYHQI